MSKKLSTESIEGVLVEELTYRFETPVSATKRALALCYVLSILVIFLSIAWFIFAAYQATKIMMITEVASCLLGIGVFVLLRTGFIDLAKHILVSGLLIWIILNILLLSGPGGAATGGVHFFLIPIAAGCIVVFSDSSKYYGLIYAFASFVIFLFAEYNIIPFKALVPIPEAARVASHMIVVTGSFLSVIVLAAVFVTDMANTERLFQAVNEWLERVLKRVLPSQIVDRLRLNERTFAETIEECSILFADIVGFTNYCRKYSAEGVVATLSKIFSQFDDLARKHGVEKIKTIGDAYMAASGVPESQKDHAVAISAFALDLCDYMDSIDGLEIRIGINSGSVVAGLIGKDRFLYDLWGAAVNMASRMESTGEAGVIQITKETAELVSENYCVLPRGNVEAKGIGMVNVYSLERLR